MTNRTRFLGVLIGLGLLSVAATFTIAAQSGQPSSDPIAALLTEVRALRIAMEQNATLAPRLQLTLARLNIEEQRIAQLGIQLDRVRQDQNNARLETQKLVDALAEIERRVSSVTDQNTREILGSEQGDLSRRIKSLAAIEEQLRVRENEAAQALSAEQSRWIDLNGRLDELDRLLGPTPR
jgi:septal ring factor EnvC (AmiA/AmiB activator)